MLQEHTTFLVMSLSLRAFKAGSRSDLSKFAFPAILNTSKKKKKKKNKNDVTTCQSQARRLFPKDQIGTSKHPMESNSIQSPKTQATLNNTGKVQKMVKS